MPVVDEGGKHRTPQRIPAELATLVPAGRKRRPETALLSRRPNRLNEFIPGEVTGCMALP